MLNASLRTFLLLVAAAGTFVAGCHSASISSSVPMLDPAKRTVLVTGANRGIGLEIARQYHAAGWNVIATARDPSAAGELAAIGADVLVPSLDVTSAASVAALAKSLEGRPIDVLINNAGVGDGGGSSIAKLDLEKFGHVLQVNTIGSIRVTQALLPNLRAGQGRTIVSISSVLGSITADTEGGNYGYRESKAALNMFMRSLAAELRSEHFICIAIHPGWVRTDMGGPNAPLTAEQSVAGIRKVLDGLQPADSGKFWSYDGSNLPW
jgi:NAD(P)-dependent dehydrogenase (short-subunit alcohol dehydrogenase family)